MRDLRSERIAVTGGGGFLGSRVLAELHRRGCASVAAPRKAECDLTQEQDVCRFYATYQPDLVIHLAGVVGGIGANQANPGRFFYDNLMMGTLLMEHARRSGVRKFVATGTVCCYPKHAAVPFREDDLWNGYPEETNAPYGLAKKMLLVQAQAYREQYGFNAIFLLPVNLYGPGDNFDPESSHVIPALIRKCVEAREMGAGEVAVWGDPSTTREFLYVDDCARAIVDAAARYDDGDPVNIGTGREITIEALARTIASQTGFAGRLAWLSSRPAGQPRRCLDVIRAERLFGFRATTPLEEGLARTVAWYVQNRATTVQEGRVTADTR